MGREIASSAAFDGLVAMTDGCFSVAGCIGNRTGKVTGPVLRGFDLHHFAHRGRLRPFSAFALQVADLHLDRLADQLESSRLGLVGRDAAG